MSTEITNPFSSRLSDLVRWPDEDISLAEAALCVSGLEYPDLDVAQYISALESLATSAESRMSDVDGPRETAKRLGQFLALGEGFQGNLEDYYDPQNSCLNRVLDRRMGIPITLSIVYMEVGRLLGLSLYGIGLPGHFVLRVGPPQWDLYLDPFNEGRVMDRTGCRRIVEELFQGRFPFRDEFLEPLSRRRILVRVLSNLKGIYQEKGDIPRAIAAADHVDMIEPGMPDNLKDRAWFHRRARHYRKAIEDLEAYVRSHPEADGREQVRGQIRSIWEELAAQN